MRHAFLPILPLGLQAGRAIVLRLLASRNRTTRVLRVSRVQTLLSRHHAPRTVSITISLAVLRPKQYSHTTLHCTYAGSAALYYPVYPVYLGAVASVPRPENTFATSRGIRSEVALTEVRPCATQQCVCRRTKKVWIRAVTEPSRSRRSARLKAPPL